VVSVVIHRDPQGNDRPVQIEAAADLVLARRHGGTGAVFEVPEGLELIAQRGLVALRRHRREERIAAALLTDGSHQAIALVGVEVEAGIEDTARPLRLGHAEPQLDDVGRRVRGAVRFERHAVEVV
jgi:hypothetical protein